MMLQRKKPPTRIDLMLRTTGMVVAVIVVGAVSLGATVGAYRMFQRDEQASEERDAAQTQLASLVAQDAQVKSDIAALSSERGIEAALRERYSVAAPGEGVIQIVDQLPSMPTTTASTSSNFFTQILHSLFPW